MQFGRCPGGLFQLGQMGVENPRVGVWLGLRCLLTTVGLWFNWVLCFCCVTLWKNGFQMFRMSTNFHSRQNAISRFGALFVGLDQLGGMFGAGWRVVFLHCENDGGEILKNGGTLWCSVELSAGAFRASISILLLLLCLDCLNMVLGSPNANWTVGFFLGQEWAGADQCRLYFSSVRFIRRSMLPYLGMTNRGSPGQSSVCFDSTRMKVCVCVCRPTRHAQRRLTGRRNLSRAMLRAVSRFDSRHAHSFVSCTGRLRECRVSGASYGVLARDIGTRVPKSGVERAKEG
jgi:hypothetical protein